jgi:hypothetical protein
VSATAYLRGEENYGLIVNINSPINQVDFIKIWPNLTDTPFIKALNGGYYREP